MKSLVSLLFCSMLPFHLFGEEVKVLLPQHDYAVPAVLSLPDNVTQPVPAVILLHGTASQKDEVGGLFKTLSEQLAANGIGSIRIDFAGYGESQASMLNYSLTTAVGDAKVAIAHLAAHPAIDANRIGVLGFSQGALIAQLVAIESSQIMALVGWSPAVGNGTTPMQSFYDTHYAKANDNGFATIALPWRSDIQVSKIWFDELAQQQSLTQLAHFTGPVLAVGGSNDTVLPWQNANQMVIASGSNNGQAVVIKDADHIFNVLQDDTQQSKALLSVTTSWLKNNL